jgi:hypothetical protein
MRRHLDFYDFLLWSVSILLLTLTIPVLPGWFHFSGTRQFVVTITFLVGAIAMWAACSRPRLLRDHPTDRIDLRDWFMAASGLFFAVEARRNFLRWDHSGITPHKMAIVVALAAISLFAFYCILDRGGLRKFRGFCFLLGFMLLVPASWKIATKAASPMYFYISEPKETGYVWLVSAVLFLACGVFAHVVQKRREHRG